MAFQIRVCEWCEAEVAFIFVKSEMQDFFFLSKQGEGNGKPEVITGTLIWMFLGR